MPTQVFKITRAPESQPLTARGLRSLLWRNQRDSEWTVKEMDMHRCSICGAIFEGKKCPGENQWDDVLKVYLHPHQKEQ